MTPEQALQVLNQLASMAPANRQDHAMAVQAVQTLQSVLDNSAAEVANDGNRADVEVATE